MLIANHPQMVLGLYLCFVFKKQETKTQKSNLYLRPFISNLCLSAISNASVVISCV